MIRLPALARRLGWGVGDQALSSLTNFLLGVAVARTADPIGFGAFGVVFATFLLVLNASRALVSDPLLVRHSGADPQHWRRAVAACTGTAVSIGIGGGALCVLAGLLLLNGGRPWSAGIGGALIALGVSLPGLLLQDSWRFCFFAAGRGSDAVVNDLVWAVALGALLAGASIAHASALWVFVAAWGASGTLAALVGSYQAAVLPRPALLIGWITDHRALAVRYLAENLSTAAGVQLRAYGIGAVTGLAAVGAVKGAELLLGPVYVLVTGMAWITVAEAARTAQRSPDAVARVCALTSTAGAAGTLVWGAVLIVGVPDRLGHGVLGATWRTADQLLLPMTLAYAAMAVMAGAWAGVRAFGAARRSLRAQLVTSALTLAGALAGAVAQGAVGAAWGTAAANAVSVGVWWEHLRRAGRDARRSASAAGAVRRTLPG